MHKLLTYGFADLAKLCLLVRDRKRSGDLAARYLDRITRTEA
ncbi:MAG TPA: hypothetical protein QF813_07010 [Alphaproteobacteria bacterium]|nr:hypothetical protein [Alphaproteobacteria bacterium]